MQTFDNNTFKNTNLSPTQKGILFYLLSQEGDVIAGTPSDWSRVLGFNKSQTLRHFTDLHEMSLIVRENIVLDDDTDMIKISNFRG
jgi:DNA-binding MarR family transcriptional regulator